MFQDNKISRSPGQCVAGVTCLTLVMLVTYWVSFTYVDFNSINVSSDISSDTKNPLRDHIYGSDHRNQRYVSSDISSDTKTPLSDQIYGSDHRNQRFVSSDISSDHRNQRYFSSGWRALPSPPPTAHDGRLKNNCTLEELSQNYKVQFGSTVTPPLLKKYKNPCWRENSENFCLPYFWLAGFPKSGTTDLFRRLIRHPSVLAPQWKEPHFITRNIHGRMTSSCKNRRDSASCVVKIYARKCFGKATKTIMDGPAHQQHIAEKLAKLGQILDLQSEITNYTSGYITLDASASTAWDNREWTRRCSHRSCPNISAFNPAYVSKLNPNAKIIMLLREPIDRVYSGFAYFSRGRKPPPSPKDFHTHSVKFVEKFNKCLTNGSSVRECTYKAQLKQTGLGRHYVSVYHVYIEDWLKHFSKEDLLILRSEDYHQDIQGTLRKVFKFLKLPELDVTSLEDISSLGLQNTNSKRKSVVGQILPETRKLLQDFFQPHNALLAKLLDDETFNWDYSQH